MGEKVEAGHPDGGLLQVHTSQIGARLFYLNIYFKNKKAQTDELRLG